MPAGTIALTNNSATVTGSGTSFTTELKVNDFVVSTVGGVAYTLGVKSIESNTSLTLMESYTGPSASGQSWTSVPYGTMAAITAQLAAQVTYAIRGLNLDKANWQQVFTAPGNITVSLPDGTSWQGPSWAYMATQFSNKANTTDVLTKADNLASVTDKATARSNLGVAYGNTAGSVAQGNDSRIVNAVQKSGGSLTGSLEFGGGGYAITKPASAFSAGANSLFSVSLNDTRFVVNSDFYYSGQYVAYRIFTGDPNVGIRVWEFRTDGTFRSQGAVYANGTALTSDMRLKSDFKDVDINPDDIDKILPQTYTKKSPDNSDDTSSEMGIVAQKIEAVIPELVTKFYWNEEYPDLRMVNYSGLTAWLVGYCKKLKDRLAVLESSDKAKDAVIAELQKRMKAIDGLDA